jgi:hypothetical protein
MTKEKVKNLTIPENKNPPNSFLPIDGGGLRWGCQFLILLTLPPH